MELRQVKIEQALLGAILHNPDALIDVIGIVNERSFRVDQNRRVFSSMLALFDCHRPVDLITVQEHASSSEGGSGLISYCTDLYTQYGIEFGGNAVSYAERVADSDKWYRLNLAGAEISDMSIVQDADIEEALDRAEGLVFDIAGDTKSETGAMVGSLLQPALDEFEAARSADGGIIGISSGFADIDAITAGWKKTDLTIVAARPAMGKSALSMQIALNAALSGVRSAFFSLEMGGTQLVQRILTTQSGVDGQRARRGFTNDDDWSRLTLAAGKLHDAPLYIDDAFSLTPTELRAKCRRMKMREGLDLVVVDYLQLMQVPEAKDNRCQRTLTGSVRLLRLAVA